MTKKTPLEPLGNRVLVMRLESEKTVKGGILLPESAKKKQETATVIAVGKGRADKQGILIPPPVKVGEMILMEKYSGQDISLHDEDYVILRGEDIIAIVES